MRVVIGSSLPGGTINGKARQGAVLCRLSRKEKVQMTFQNEGDCVTLCIQTGLVEFEQLGKNGNAPAQRARNRRGTGR